MMVVLMIDHEMIDLNSSLLLMDDDENNFDEVIALMVNDLLLPFSFPKKEIKKEFFVFVEYQTCK